MSVHTRLVAGNKEDTEAWVRAVHVGFLRLQELTEEDLATRQARQDFSRAAGVFDGDRCVATYKSFAQEMTVPGGGVVSSNAVTGVTVTATHRRKGLLRGLITEDLRAAKERGDVVSALDAAEYRIYGRFGYGPTTSAVTWRVDVTRAGLDARRTGREGEGGISFLDAAQVREIGPELHERFRRTQPGAIDRDPLFWDLHTGAVRVGSRPWELPYWALHRDADGVPQGLVSYHVTHGRRGNLDTAELKVGSLIAATPAAERALWLFLLSHDRVTTLTAELSAPDAMLPLLLPDRRAASVTEDSDFIWLRPLDLPRMLEARTYGVEDEIVLDVRDPLGLAQGRYLLAASPEGASATPTGRDADLTLDTTALAQLYLGDESAVRLVAAGQVTAGRAEAPVRADLLFRTGRRPWCPDGF
ncbi:GNAT family N-acetyltransferase [Streptomyces avicenniae]|uniref:GNAT family N-acetyltransferase n=1 Tax=Streptomyces avicenniae TaxID=500153 RepID=UPI00069982F0|nr:GNAT family N-acetyltransferase [Streptomyces avicenniae]